MRIMFLCRNSMANTAGGVVEFLHYLPLALRELEIEVVMYDMGNTDDLRLQGPTLLANGVRAYSGPLIKPGWWVSGRKLQPLLDVCQQEQIDLVHAQGTYRSGFVAERLHRRTGLPYVVMSHGDIATANSDRMRRGRVQRRCQRILEQASAVSHLTPMMADASHRVHDTRRKSKTIANGIDVRSWQEMTATPEQNYVLGIGRLQREKGFHVLIDAYAELYRRGVKAALVIAGDGAEAMNLQQQARRLNLPVVTEHHDMTAIPSEGVVFTGYVTGAAKHALVAGCCVMLFPTQPSEWEEPFGIVQIEAMAAGKPLIASDAATTRYLQTLGLQSMLATPTDPLAWADHMQTLLADAALRITLGKLNRANVPQFDWRTIAMAYRDLYLGVCS